MAAATYTVRGGRRKKRKEKKLSGTSQARRGNEKKTHFTLCMCVSRDLNRTRTATEANRSRVRNTVSVCFHYNLSFSPGLFQWLFSDTFKFWASFLLEWIQSKSNENRDIVNRVITYTSHVLHDICSLCCHVSWQKRRTSSYTYRWQLRRSDENASSCFQIPDIHNAHTHAARDLELVVFRDAGTFPDHNKRIKKTFPYLRARFQVVVYARRLLSF